MTKDDTLPHFNNKASKEEEQGKAYAQHKERSKRTAGRRAKRAARKKTGVEKKFWQGATPAKEPKRC